MAHADDIQHCVHMIGAHTDLEAYDIVRYVSKLESVAREGGHVTSETEEAATLKNTVTELRNLADRIALVRESLIANSQSKPKGIAISQSTLELLKEHAPKPVRLLPSEDGELP